MNWLSDRTLEQRARRRLDRFGLKIRKSRKRNGGYTVYGGPDALPSFSGEEIWCSGIYQLLELTE